MVARLHSSFVRVFSLVLAFFAFGLLCPSRDVVSQERPQTSDETQVAPKPIDPKPIDATRKKSSGPTVVSAGGRAGTGAYPDGRWAATQVILSNDSDDDVEVEVIAYFKTLPNQRFTRRLWIPPRAVRRALIPMLVNELPGDVSFRNTVVVVKDSKTNVPIRGFGDRVEHTLPLSKPMDPFVSMMPADGLLVPDKGPSPNGGDGLQALRYGLNQHIQYSAVLVTDMPDFYLALDAVDQMVISDNSLQRDGGGAAAVRQWLSLGGQLWLMLDRLEEETAAAVFGGDMPFQIVDRVTLTEFDITADSGNARHVDSERVISLARVLLDPDVHVLYWVGDWPAAFLIPRGEGQILITTLGIDAWVMHASSPGRRRERETGGSHVAEPTFYPQNELTEAGQHFLSGGLEQPVKSADFQAYLSERVGYEVVSGTTVGAILLAFVVLLLALGLVLRRMERLAYMLIVAPVIVAATIGLLFVLGANAGAIPRTVGVIQWIRVAPDMREASVRGEIALYHPNRSDVEVGASGSVYSLDTSGQQGVERTLRWTDRDSFAWDKLTLPAGLRFADWRRPLYFSQPPRAQAQFGDLDMSGAMIDSAWKDLEDAIVLFPSRPPLPIDINDDGSLTVRSGDPLGEGQFVPGKLLSDEQRRRQNLVKSINARRPTSGFPERPVVMAWTSAEPVELHVRGKARRFHSSLITIPIEFVRPQPGTPVTIGSSFIPVRTTMSPFGEGQASVFDAIAGKWVSLTKPTSAWLHFQLPKELLGIEIETAKVVVDISVPSRNVEFRTVLNGEAVAQGEEASPAGPRNFSLTAGEDFDVDDKGGILFGVRISDAETKDERKPIWKINDVRMTVVGRMPE